MPMKPPFKLALAALFLDGKPRSATDVSAELQSEYGGRRFFTKPFAATSLQSLASIGVFENCGASENGDPLYKISPHGCTCVRKNLRKI